jgi:hypothetical protein
MSNLLLSLLSQASLRNYSFPARLAPAVWTISIGLMHLSELIMEYKHLTEEHETAKPSRQPDA